MNEDLNLIWSFKVEEANEQDLVSFIFEYDGNFYISNWHKAKWQEPKLIKML